MGNREISLIAIALMETNWLKMHVKTLYKNKPKCHNNKYNKDNVRKVLRVKMPILL